MTKGPQPRAILVFGVPMSGKTSFSEQFSEQFRAPHLNLTSLERDHNVPRDTLLVIVKELAKCKQTMILEGGIGTESDRKEIRELLRKSGYTTSLVWIQTDLATVQRRMKVKFGSPAKAKQVFDRETAHLEAPAEHEKPIVVSGKHTFESQLRTVLANLSRDDLER